MTKMIAGQALVKVLEDWDVDHIYGVPGGSINHTVEGLYLEKDSRVAQMIVATSEDTVEYDGQFQGGLTKSKLVK